MYKKKNGEMKGSNESKKLKALKEIWGNKK